MSRNSYYVERGHVARNCWTCDGVHACKCDKVTIRATKRSARQVWARRTSDEIDEATAAASAAWDFDEWPSYLCGDCLDEESDCPRCGGQGAVFSAFVRSLGFSRAA